MKKGSSLRSNLRFGILDGLFAVPWTVTALPTSFLFVALLNKYYGLDAATFGVIASMPAWGNALQVLLLPLVSRFIRVRDLALTQGWMNLGFWAMLSATIGFFPRDEFKNIGGLFVVFFALAMITQSLSGVSWMSWITEFVPRPIRGRYMGVRQRYCNIMTMLVLVIGWGMLYWGEQKLWVYQAFLIGCTVLRAFSLLMLHRVRTRDPYGGAVAEGNWLGELGRLRTNTALIRFILFNTLVNFALGAGAVLVPRFVFDQLEVSAGMFSAISLAGSLGGFLMYRQWGRIADRHGNVPVVIVSLLLWRLLDVTWLLITPGTWWVMFLTWFAGGLAASGFLLGMMNLLLALVSEKSRMAGISLNTTISSISAAMATMLTGYFINQVALRGVDMVPVFRGTFAVAMIASIVPALLLIGIKEPAVSQKANTVMGTMRTLRQLLLAQGSASLNVVVPFKRRGRHKK